MYAQRPKIHFFLEMGNNKPGNRGSPRLHELSDNIGRQQICNNLGLVVNILNHGNRLTSWCGAFNEEVLVPGILGDTTVG